MDGTTTRVFIFFKKKITMTGSSRSRQILLQHSQHLALLGRGLIDTMPELGRSVDPLEFDLLERLAVRVREHGLAQRDDSFLDARNGTFDEHKVVLDLSIPNETTHATEREREITHQISVPFLVVVPSRSR